MAGRGLFLLLLLVVLVAVPAQAVRHAVSMWTVADVQRWVNTSLGYPEYSEAFLGHRVDGPTLLFLETKELEETLGVSNGVHLAKFKAHLQLLRDSCICPHALNEQVAADFWDYMRHHPLRVWGWGMAAVYHPRLALLGVFLFDNELYKDLTYVAGVTVVDKHTGQLLTLTEEPSLVLTLCYWVFGMLCPAVYFLINWLPYTATNALVVLLVSPVFVLAQHWEVMLFLQWLHGEFKDVSWKERLQLFIPLTAVVPILGLAAGYLLPHFVLQLMVCAFIIMSIVMTSGFLVMLFGPEQNKGKEQEAQQAAEGKKHE